MLPCISANIIQSNSIFALFWEWYWLMGKKKRGPSKAAEKRTSRRKPAAKRGQRSTGPLPRSLAIVKSDFGRAMQLRVRLGMSRQRFARLVPMSTRNLAYLESGKPATASLRRQLIALSRLIDALATVVEQDTIGHWLQQANKQFDGLKPVEVLERGEVDRIWQMIFRQGPRA